MIVVELTLKGYDGGNDDTDHLIKHVCAADLQLFWRWFRLFGIGELVQSPPDFMNDWWVREYGEIGGDLSLAYSYSLARGHETIALDTWCRVHGHGYDSHRAMLFAWREESVWAQARASMQENDA